MSTHRTAEDLLTGTAPPPETPALSPLPQGAASWGLPLLLLGALALAAFLARRGGRFTSGVLRPLGTCSLGPRRHATLLRVGSRMVLVGVAEGSVRALGEWDLDVLGDEAPTGDEPSADDDAERRMAPSAEGWRRFQRFLGTGLLVLTSLGLAGSAQAQGVTVELEGLDGWEPGRLTRVIEIATLITALSFLPALMLTATCFTRFVVVFHFLRQALGIPGTPPNQVLVGLALFLTAFVMGPVASESWERGLVPYRDGEISFEEAVTEGSAPLRRFMLRNTRAEDLILMQNIAGDPMPASPEEVSFKNLIPAFVISELNTAFTAGFLIFLPFLVVDLLVASVLLSMGMMMMPPVMVSMPLKVMVFVLAGGWNLLVVSFVSGVH